jgi:hypothetical protein
MDPRALRRWLLLGVAIIATFGVVVELAAARFEGPLVDALVPRLSLSYEGNVPTWFSSSLLLACALAAGAIARTRPPWRRHWWGLAIGFSFASLDEAVGLHEHLGGNFDTSGVLYFDWVIPAIAILAVLAAIYLPFVWALPSRTRTRLVIAGVIYVGGALVMELPLGWWTERAGDEGLGYAMIDWVEETLEMIGASLGIVAMVAHRQERT